MPHCTLESSQKANFERPYREYKIQKIQKYTIQSAEYRIQRRNKNSKYRILNAKHKTQKKELRIQNTEYKIHRRKVAGICSQTLIKINALEKQILHISEKCTSKKQRNRKSATKNDWSGRRPEGILAEKICSNLRPPKSHAFLETD